LKNYDYGGHKKLIFIFLEYRVIQKEISIFLEVTVSISIPDYVIGIFQ